MPAWRLAERWSRHGAWLFPLLLAAVVYAPAPGGDLVWDDPIVLERQLGVISSVGDALFPPEGIPQWSPFYYRPVVTLSYMLDFGLYGRGGSVGVHLSNVLWHLLTTLLVWLLARRLLESLPNASLGAALAASVFAVHPIHTESVSWISGRSDLLAAALSVASVLLALRWRDRGSLWALALGAAFYLSALLAKEVAIATILIAPATLILARPRAVVSLGCEPTRSPQVPARGMVGILAALGLAHVVATLCYFALRHAATVSYGESLALPWVEQLWQLARATAYYLIKVAVPWPQSCFVVWEMLPGRVGSAGVLLLGLGLLGLAVRLWRRRAVGAPLAGLLWFGFSLAPSLLIAVGKISEAPVAERYLYLPSVGSALIVAGFWCELSATRWRKTASSMIALLICGYAAATLERGFVWRDDVRLWRDVTSKVASQGLPWNQLGTAYAAQGDRQRALESYLRALDSEYDPEGRAKAHSNSGMLYLAQADRRTAEHHFEAAIEQDAGYRTPYYGLGLIYAQVVADLDARERSGEARDAFAERAVGHFEAAILLSPAYERARLRLASLQLYLGGVLESQGSIEEATTRYRVAQAQLDALRSRASVVERNPALERLRVQLEQALDRLER